MNWLVVTILLSVSAHARSSLPAFSTATPVEPAPGQQSVSACPLGRMADSLRNGGDWQDLSVILQVNPELRRTFADIMPDFQLAFLHHSSHGVLLIQGTPLEESPIDGEEAERFWREVVDETRSSCASSGVACAVRRLPGAPQGLSASTRIPQGRDVYRRETLAFIGADHCSYAIQFSGPESTLSPEDWKNLHHRLDALRQLVAASHP